MFNKRKILSVFVAASVLSIPASAGVKKGDKSADGAGEITGTASVAGTANVLWREPADIRSRNLYYGSGGKEHEPHSTFTFDKEDLDGSNVKFVVRDENGMKWKAKLGTEAKPETVAARLVWAAGYFTNEDYFVPEMKVQEMPAHLHRRGAGKYIEADGSMRNVRLKRTPDGEKKIGIWRWRNDPFAGTREYNGLRVLMALINNWDLKDINNAMYEEKNSAGERIYMVSDLGASFGSWGLGMHHQESKGNLDRVQAPQVHEEDRAGVRGVRNASPACIHRVLRSAGIREARASGMDRPTHPAPGCQMDGAIAGSTFSRSDSRCFPRRADIHPTKWKDFVRLCNPGSPN